MDVGFDVGKQKNTPLTINHSTEKTFTAYPKIPRLNGRGGSLPRPAVARIPCGTVYVKLSMSTLVLIMVLNARVLAIYSIPYTMHTATDRIVVRTGKLKWGWTLFQYSENGKPF